MGLFNKSKKTVENNGNTGIATQIVTSNSYTYMYDSSNVSDKDIVQAAIRPITDNCGKLNPVLHVTDNKTVYNTTNIQALLSAPCTVYSMQKIIEHAVYNRTLYGNGFVLIVRDSMGNPVQLQPVFATSAKAVNNGGTIYVQLTNANGVRTVYKYSDLIHLRREPKNSIFGRGLVSAVNQIMETSEMCDNAVKTSVRNANNLRWMLRFPQTLKPKDKQQHAREFAETFLNTTTTNGVGYTDTSYEAIELKTAPFIPQHEIPIQLQQRIYNLFGVSENILQNKATDNEANSFYENVIEPIALELSNELTLKLLTAEQRRKGCKIICESNNLYCLSMEVKLQMVQLVDRGVLTPNELRGIMGKAPIAGGDKALLRKDTGTLTAANNVN